MQKLLTDLIDLIFPPRGGALVLNQITSKNLISLQQGGFYKGIEYIGHYSNPIIRTAITENKFNHNKRAAELLSDLFKLWLKKHPAPILFIPIPLSTNRERARGFNQVEKILRQAGVTSFSTKLLKRKLETLPQTKLHKSHRQKNLSGAFIYTGENINLLEYKQVVLFDDVVTTGATLLAAQAELASHLPPHITLRCLAIAH